MTVRGDICLRTTREYGSISSLAEHILTQLKLWISAHIEQ